LLEGGDEVGAASGVPSSRLAALSAGSPELGAGSVNASDGMNLGMPAWSSPLGLEQAAAAAATMGRSVNNGERSMIIFTRDR
jgi:hypothetical protein